MLGRGDQADIQLQDTFASSQHARLAPHGDVMVLEDLGSTNGTYLNEEPLRGPQPLHPGDRIRIGDSSVHLRYASHAPHFRTVPRLRSRPPAAGQRGQLLRPRAPVRGRRRHGRRAGRRGRLGDRGRLVRRRARQRLARRRPGARHPGGQPPHPRPLAHRRAGRRHGHDLHGRLRRRGRRHDRPRRRLARLPLARRRADAAHARPLAGRRARGARQADRGAGGGAPAALGDHARARPGARRPGRRRDVRRARRRRLPALLGRPDVDDPRGRRAARDGADDRARPHGPRADRRRQRRGRARQHHGHPVPPRGRRRRGRRRRRAGAEATAKHEDDGETGEYDTFEGEAVSPRQGASRPYAHTRGARRGGDAPGGGRQRRARRRRAGGGVPRQRHGRAVGDRAARPRRAGRGAGHG